jgi:C1A family cysteine protease
VGDLKKLLYAYGTLAVAVRVGDLFQNYSGGVFNYNETVEPINHAVALVGWDDDDSGGVWYLRNSWGPQWGENNGYMRIKYESSQIGFGAMWVEAIPPGPPPDDHRQDLKSSIDERIRWWETNYPQFVPSISK